MHSATRDPTLRRRAARRPARRRRSRGRGQRRAAFKEGDVITFDQVEKLKPFLPEQFWDNRDFFFYEGMKLEIGPTQCDYSPAKECDRRDREVQGPAEDRPRRQPRELRRRPALPAGRRSTARAIRRPAPRSCGTSSAPGGDGARPLLLLLLGPRRAAAALLRGHRRKTIVLSHRVEKEYSRRTAATSSAARSARTPSASRWTRPSTRAASCC